MRGWPASGGCCSSHGACCRRCSPLRWVCWWGPCRRKGISRRRWRLLAACSCSCRCWRRCTKRWGRTSVFAPPRGSTISLRWRVPRRRAWRIWRIPSSPATSRWRGTSTSASAARRFPSPWTSSPRAWWNCWPASPAHWCWPPTLGGRRSRSPGRGSPRIGCCARAACGGIATPTWCAKPSATRTTPTAWPWTRRLPRRCACSGWPPGRWSGSPAIAADCTTCAGRPRACANGRCWQASRW